MKFSGSGQGGLCHGNDQIAVLLGRCHQLDILIGDPVNAEAKGFELVGNQGQ